MKDLIKQKISEALSASSNGDREEALESLIKRLVFAAKNWGNKETREGSKAADITAAKEYVGAVVDDLVLIFREEKEKRESEIKSALETIDWDTLLK